VTRSADVPQLNPRLPDILACPRCRSALSAGEQALECAGCGATFPLAAGVPVLTPDGRLPAVPDARGAWRRSMRPILAQKFATRRLPERFVASFPSSSLILNVGAGAEDYGPNVIDLDLAQYGSVDVIGLAGKLPFADESFAGCIAQAVLEHVDDAEEAVEEIRRVLVPGGRVLVDVPFVQGYHAVPRDHRRFTEEGLRATLERHGFAVEASGVAVGPGSAMATVTAEYLALLLSGRSAGAYRFTRLLTSWLALPLKYTDAWLAAHPRAGVIASGVWAHARKLGQVERVQQP
jgi:SAM-dependent methyltransferase